MFGTLLDALECFWTFCLCLWTFWDVLGHLRIFWRFWDVLECFETFQNVLGHFLDVSSVVGMFWAVFVKGLHKKHITLRGQRH